jgi:hypothetical protein
MSHERYIRLIDEMIVGDVPAPEWNELHRHLVGCSSCRARYDRASLAERMLHGGPKALDTPSASTLKRLEGAVLGASTPRAPAWQRAVQWLTPTQRWAAGVAVAAAVVVLIPFLVRSPAPHAEFQARGTQTHERTAGLRAFCIGDEGVTARCLRSTQLRLTVSNAGKFQKVFVVGFDDDYNPKWYAPRPPEGVSVNAPDGVDQQIGAAVKLGVNHDPGKVRIYALFSDAPVSTQEVEAAADRLRETGRKPSQIESLPLLRTDVIQKSLVLDVE